MKKGVRIFALAAFLIFSVLAAAGPLYAEEDSGTGTYPANGGNGTLPPQNTLPTPDGDIGAPPNPAGPGTSPGDNYGVPQSLKGGITDPFSASSWEDASRICNQVASAALKTSCRPVKAGSQWVCDCR